MTENPILVDTTLREGTQSAGLNLTGPDRIELVRRLTGAGIQEIEVGTPAMGAKESEIIAEIAAMKLPARILTWNRALERDLEASFQTGVKNVFISAPVSDLHIEKKLQKDRGHVLRTLEKAVELARMEGCYVVCGLEDATRADAVFRDEVCDLLVSIGADRIRIADTVGILTPERTHELFRHLSSRFPVPLEIHAHNDFGLATANTLAAFLAGARYLDTTLMGAGERAGNAAMEEVLLALENLYGRSTGFRMNRLRELIDFFAGAGGIPVPLWKSAVGQYAFTHSSGIHVDGMLKDPSTYEPFSPEQIGQKREFLIGRNSGRAAIIQKAAELGINLNKEEAALLAQTLRAGEGGITREIFRNLITQITHR